MTAEEFNKILERRLCRVRETLIAKAAEYASDDRLHNFRAGLGGVETSETPAQVLWGYLRKHLQSLYDMVDGLRAPTPAAIDEKIGDAVVYLCLLEALFLEPLSEAGKK